MESKFSANARSYANANRQIALRSAFMCYLYSHLIKKGKGKPTFVIDGIISYAHHGNSGKDKTSNKVTAYDRKDDDGENLDKAFGDKAASIIEHMRTHAYKFTLNISSQDLRAPHSEIRAAYRPQFQKLAGVVALSPTSVKTTSKRK